jgi:5-methylthioadenosine/S-adenosylhomocysteine deaminase
MLLLARQRAGETDLSTLLTVREVIEFATTEGAKDNRLDQKIGTLTPGKEADIIMLRMDQINVMPVNNVYGAIVLGMDTRNVDTVFIGGKLCKSKGKLVGVDLNRVSRLVHQSRDHIVSKAGWPRTRLGGTYRVIETYGNRPDSAVGGGGSNAVGRSDTWDVSLPRRS